MDDETKERREQFYVMLGACCDSARLADLPVRFTLEDGREVEGVPEESASAEADEAGIDDTGTRRRLHIGGEVVCVTQVCRYSVALAT